MSKFERVVVLGPEPPMFLWQEMAPLYRHMGTMKGPGCPHCWDRYPCHCVKCQCPDCKKKS
jgi:hypothetical protein